MATHKCRAQGDHIVRIAREKGYHDWKRVWHENGPLKSARANPLLLFKGDKSSAGDEVTLPPKKNHKASQPTGEEKTYVVPKPKLCLRLRILFGEFTPLEDADFELTLEDGTIHAGKTDAQGRILVDGDDPKLQDADTSARLVVRAPPQSTADGVASDVPVTWELKIGKLNPIMESAPNSSCLSGVQARLNNLGLDAGPVDGIMGANTKAAVEAFQSLFGLGIDGIPGQGETQPKLVEVHDDGSFTGPPPGKLEVKHPVPSDKKMPTDVADIGHVAPDFLDASSKFVNALVLRPQYRVKLELASLSSLYLHKAGSDLGRIERLQVCGLHYFPMGHKKAKDALAKAWTLWSDTLNTSGDPDTKLEDKAQEFVVEGGSLPEPVEEGGDPKAEAAKHYRKIRIPGGHNYRDRSADARFHPLHDSSYPLGFGSAEMHEAEAFFLKDNPVVGSVPLLAIVEQRFGEDAEWKPAPDIAVYFQLVEPYELPDFDDAVSSATQINRPPLHTGHMWTGAITSAGPAKLDDAVRARGLLADDPHVDNCPSDQGGKRGKAVLGSVFEDEVEIPGFDGTGKLTKRETKPRPGFRQAHEGDRAGEVHPPFFNGPKRGSPPHSVKVMTNEAGIAGMVFRPSTMGGDRYRLKAFVGEPSYDSDGTGTDAISVETGTFVVWRNARLHKVYQLDYQTLAETVWTQLETQEDLGALGWANKDDYHEQYLLPKYSGLHTTDGSDVGYPTLDLTETGDTTYAYDSFTKSMARAYYEIEYDPGFDTPEVLDDAKWRAALQAAREFAKTKNPFQLDLDKLFIDDASKVDASNSFVFIPLLAPREYNKLIPNGSAFKKIKCKADGTFTSARKSQYDSWFDECILYPFVSSLVEDGMLPSMSLVQMPTISTWHNSNVLGDYSIGLGSSCTVLNGGKADFPHGTMQNISGTLKRKDGSTNVTNDTGFDGLVTHELGHCMFRQHARPDPGGVAMGPYHDPTGNVYCVMTYKVNEGHFCAKCLFALRGWTKFKSL